MTSRRHDEGPPRDADRTRANLPDRPTLRRGVRRLWRGPDQLQLGRDPRRAVVVTQVDDALWDLLQQLDGRHTLEALLASTGVDDASVLALLHRLDDAGLLDDARVQDRASSRLTVVRRDQLAPERDALVVRQRRPGDGTRAFSRRTAARVAVEGLGRVGAALALLLDGCGVGNLTVVDDAEVQTCDVAPMGHRLVDVSRARAAALRDRLAPAPTPVSNRARRRAAAGEHERRPDLVVLTDALTLGERLHRSDALSHADVPHLVLDVADGVGRVGPFVLPGRSACLRCLEQARADRDPQWPVLLAQLVDAPAEVPSAVLSAQLAVTAAAEVCAWLDESAATTVDAQVLVEPPAYRPLHRPLPRHPGCGCAWGGTIAS